MDIPINDLGRRQALRNGRTLAPLVAASDWQWFASPLGRTRETLALVVEAAAAGPVDIEFDDRLKEISYGRWEGLTAVEIEKAEPDIHRAREADKWSQKIPEGESYALLAARIANWLVGLTQPSIVVSHGGVMRVLMHLLAGIPTDVAPMHRTPQDRIVHFRNRTMVMF